MERLLKQNPAETFLIEGHTDAVGSELANLALSDRRAEAVADALTNVFGIPPENLTTQGYGEQYLKVRTQEPERENRRVAIRRITRWSHPSPAPTDSQVFARRPRPWLIRPPRIPTSGSGRLWRAYRGGSG
jgi:hypothetical protein